MVNFRFKLTGGKLDSEGYLLCRSKSYLVRRIDFPRSLSSRQGFTRPIIAVSRLWCCCDNLGGDGEEVIWRGSRPRMLVEKQGLVDIPIKYVSSSGIANIIYMVAVIVFFAERPVRYT